MTATSQNAAGRAVPANPAGSDLQAAVVVRRRSFVLDAAIDAAPGEVVALMGPNGSGKSTMLGVLAGLTIPDGGRVTLGGRVLTGPGVLVPPERRRVGLMGQDPLLFPHLTALENIAFGPRSQGVPRAQARAAAEEWLGRVGLSAMGPRKPHQLSGGQRQRIALARALAAHPQLLLLDEPLGALDISTAPEIRQVLRTHLRATGTTTVLVTHDVLDTAVLADRMVVLAAGSVVDEGPALELFASPRSEFTAALAGLNLIPGTVESVTEEGTVTVSAGGVQLTGIADAAIAAAVGGLSPGAADPSSTGVGAGLSTGAIAGPAMRPTAGQLAVGDAVAVVFPPSAVAVFRSAPGRGSPRNVWTAVVQAIEPGPTAVRLRTGTALAVSADVTPAAVAELGIAGGEQVWLAVKATEVRVYRR